MAVQSLVPCFSTARCNAASSSAPHRFHTRFFP